MGEVPAELVPFLVGDLDRETGEWAMHCPHPDHEDAKRSASLNINSGVWFCFGCDRGGRAEGLVQQIRDGEWNPNGEVKPKEAKHQDQLSDDDVRHWYRQLAGANFRDERKWLIRTRGISRQTIRARKIGYDPLKRVYTIPIYDSSGELVNIRKYDRNPKPDFPKMHSVKGHGRPTLYPIDHLELDGPLIICEGEWDALLTTQNGFPALTRTGAADVWHHEWSPLFRNKEIIVIHDMDSKGQKANALVRAELAEFVKDIKVVKLPFEVIDKGGKDLSDFWNEGGTPEEFEKILRGDDGPRFDFTVLDSLDGSRLGQPGKLEVRIAGVGNRNFLVPNLVGVACSQDFDEDLCATCPMISCGGSKEIEIPASSRSTLGVLYGGHKAEREMLIRETGIESTCNEVRFTTLTAHTVQKMFVTQAIDDTTTASVFGDDAQHYSTIRQVHAVGVHDALSNATMEMTGCMQSNPKDRGNEFVAWGVRKVETSIDKFSLEDDEVDDLYTMLYAEPGQVPAKLADVADEMAEHVTHIYGRRNMHIMMDLVFHSVLQFTVGREDVPKGWLDAIVVGETRTGKSEAATRLVQNYRSGSVISCESASIAGVLGGVQSLGSNEWVVTWGVVPFNDQRLVVLDEVSGLSSEEIGSLSSMRSSGIAELTKIKSEKTLARTRLLWIGNPRNSQAHYTSGMRMLEDLIEKPEDLARFDLAMSVHAGEPGTERANEPTMSPPDRFTEDHLLRKNLMWAWSRRTEDVIVLPDTATAIYDAAKRLGRRYSERPPLVQTANVRMKIARLAVAIAARTFSTEDGLHLLVRPDHVAAAVGFMRSLYDSESFGYGEESRLERERIKISSSHWEDAKRLLVEKRELALFLRGAHDRFTVLELRNSAQYPDLTTAINDAGVMYQWGFLDNLGKDFQGNKQLMNLLKEIPR